MKTSSLFIITALTTTSLYAGVGKITALNGLVSIQRSNSTLAGSLGATLEAKDSVKTGQNSKAQLTFNDRTIITVGKESLFSIDDYLFDGTKESSTRFNIVSGSIRAMSGQIGKIAPEKFAVKTKTATIGIRGTNFIVAVEPNGASNILCTQGNILVSGTNSLESTIQAGHWGRVSPEGILEKIEKIEPKVLDTILSDSFKISMVPKKSDTNANSYEPFGGIKKEALDPNEILRQDTQLNAQELNALALGTYESQTPAQGADQLFEGSITLFLHPNSIDPLVNTDKGTISVLISPTNNRVSGEIVAGDPTSKTHTLHLGETVGLPATDAFYAKFSSPVDFSDVSTGSTSPKPLLSGGIFSRADTLDDQFSWGEWSAVVQEDSAQTLENAIVHGYWAAGVKTDNAVLAGFKAAAIVDPSAAIHTYNGTFIGEVQQANTNGDFQNSTGISGTSTFNFDFGADNFNATMGFTYANNQYQVQYDTSSTSITNSSNTFSAYSATISDTTYPNAVLLENSSGSLNGSFYGNNAQIAGGTFSATGDLLAPNSDKIFVQGAFKATK
jgi:hypothetical protein